MKRKIVAVVLASTMVFGMTACGSSGASDSSSTGSDVQQQTTQQQMTVQKMQTLQKEVLDDENTLTVWTWDPNQHLCN